MTVGALVHVPVAPLPPARFKEILTPDQSAELDATVARAASLLSGRVVWNVNSTARGGGVAEMLASLIAYSRGAGTDTRWVVIGGEPEFFGVTKRIHNMLHGAAGDGEGLGPAAQAVYRRTTSDAAHQLAQVAQPGDVVILHDPQTAGLVGALRERGARVVWRAHVGVDDPGDLAHAAWQFLLPHVQPAEAYVFSRQGYVWDQLRGEHAVVIAPSIDAFSAKNQDLGAGAAEAILTATGIQVEGSETGGAAGPEPRPTWCSPGHRRRPLPTTPRDWGCSKT